MEGSLLYMKEKNMIVNDDSKPLIAAVYVFANIKY